MAETVIRFLVTGTPRSSTKWTAHALTKIGLWCTHEEAFSEWASDYGDTEDWRNQDDADSSWLAAPFTSAVKDAGVPVIGLLRDPALVARSLVRMGFFETGHPYLDFIKAHTPDVFNYEHLPDRALKFWIDWTNLIDADYWWEVPFHPRDVWGLGDRMQVPTHDIGEALRMPPMNTRHAWYELDWSFDSELLGCADDIRRRRLVTTA